MASCFSQYKQKSIYNVIKSLHKIYNENMELVCRTKSNSKYKKLKFDH